MKKRTILNLITYIIIAISVAILIFSATFCCYKQLNDTKNGNIDVQNEDKFVSVFMSEVSSYTRALIYHESFYNQVEDNNTTIFYKEKNNYYNSIENLKLFISYKDKVITNVELTSETNTVQGIKNFINSQDLNKLSIINGEVKSDTEALNKKAVKYFNEFNLGYYPASTNAYQNFIEEDKINKSNNIIETKINDFEIYASYDNNIIDLSIRKEFENLMNRFEPYASKIYISIPICTIVIIVCIVYLIYAIGNNKDKENIELTWIDKIYYEILLIISIILICIATIPLAIGLETNILNNNLYFSISMVSITYFLIYIVLAVIFNTTIKRIKAKAFWKTTIAGKIVIFIYKKIKELFNDVKTNYESLKETLPRNKKLILYMASFIILEILLLEIFKFVGFIADIILGIYVFNKIMKYINSYENLEKKLKDVYEGNNQIGLSENDVEKEFRSAVKYINDISNGFENAVEESIKSERLKTELITNVSHDIKTPLTSIINYVDLLKQENIDNKKVNEYIKVLDSKSQRLKKLTEDLVEVSKASSGSIKINMEKININELLKQSIGEFEDKFKNNELDIITNYSKNDIYINADSKYLYRVIENLFSNISKYALENSRVYIDVTEENEKAKLVIKNISKYKLNISSEELMQRFVRGDRARTTEGSGLGLSIAQSLIELQKGDFNLQIDGDLFKIIIKLNLTK